MIAGDTPGKRGRGRPPGLTHDQVKQIIDMRRDGASLTQIAITLNAKDVPTPGSGSHWDKWAVWRVLRTRYVRETRVGSN
jgi:transposase